MTHAAPATTHETPQGAAQAATAPVPKVLLRADRDTPELSPLSDDRPAALLPVAGKPLLFHALEDLALSGIHDVVVAVSHFGTLIEDDLGDGRRWGLTLAYLPTDGRASDETLRARIDPRASHPFLAIDAQIVRSPVVTACLGWLAGDAAETAGPGDTVTVTTDGRTAGITVVRPGRRPADGPPPSHLALPGMALPVRTLAEYHAANMRAVGGEIPGLFLDGRDVVNTAEDRLIAEVGSRVKARRLQDGSMAHVGQYTLVDGRASLAGRVVIGAECIIGPDTEIRDSVILPHTHIGAGLRVENAIMSGTLLIRPDLHTHTVIDDPGLAADLHPASRRRDAFAATPLSERLLALALMPAGLMRRRARHRDLWRVVLGRMRLFGVRTTDTPDLPRGAIAPSELMLPETASPEECVLADRVALLSPGGARSLRLLLHGWRHLL
ncbi:sugar phosphate nucleotidyltransferase [Roseospira visakhapatnamensis]|uniref:GTP:adenosylcobinamide-phosphate guanylyltransferase n=1 Tax=Roseospira visakhapatnamensis TaxID=390880 RepID=A0A7W6W9C1_9PROT|nr:NDP-sugar synthase [Roseospira visakhapatnamensis]MBB4265292.1 GTP:adenosylcobinamide-phosphate guanylyltransferase [Roseospira visakhapatnamensis]